MEKRELWSKNGYFQRQDGVFLHTASQRQIQLRPVVPYLSGGGALKRRPACIFCGKRYNVFMGGKNSKQLSKTFGNLFVDIEKLAFGSLMLGSILKGGMDPFQTFIFGSIIAIICFVVGVWFISMSEE
jgi:hypothetical protein